MIWCLKSGILLIVMVAINRDIATNIPRNMGNYCVPDVFILTSISMTSYTMLK